jgi:hypothetical protein
MSTYTYEEPITQNKRTPAIDVGGASSPGIVILCPVASIVYSFRFCRGGFTLMLGWPADISNKPAPRLYNNEAIGLGISYDSRKNLWESNSAIDCAVGARVGISCLKKGVFNPVVLALGLA